jgi:hypothetical protein
LPDRSPPEGVRQFWREWLAAWETIQFDHRLVDAEDRVLAQSEALEAVGLSE